MILHGIMALPFPGADSLCFRDGTAACAYYIAAACTWKRKNQFEQRGEARAEYGTELLKRLGKDLTARFGRGFAWRNLFRMRNSYLGWEILKLGQSPCERLRLCWNCRLLPQSVYRPFADCPEGVWQRVEGVGPHRVREK